MFKTIKTIYKLSKLAKSPEDLEKMKTASSRSGYKLSDTDRERAEEAKQYRAELKRQEFELKKQELEIEKMQRMQELEIRREELKNLKEELMSNKESGGNMEDFLMQQFLSKIMNNQPMAAPQPSNLNSYMPQAGQDVPNGVEVPTPTAEAPQTRFKDEELKQQLPKLLNAQQIEVLKNLNLNDDELLQLGDVIKQL